MDRGARPGGSCGVGEVVNPAAWLDRAKAVPVLDVAAALGLSLGRDGKSFGPCPGCGAATRANPGRRDSRGRCAILPGGWWHCYSNGSDGCGATADSPGLVAWQLTGERWQKGDASTSAKIREWFAQNGWCDAPGAERKSVVAPRRWPDAAAEAPPSRPNAMEVAQVWFHAPAVTDDDAVAEWLERASASGHQWRLL